MMEFLPVTENEFDYVFDKMKNAFPYEERRDYNDQLKCMSDSRFKYYRLRDGESEVGFIALWHLEDFIFIEHIAIDDNLRGGGYGSKAIDLVKSAFSLPIILEAEDPVTTIQKRRIAFYEKHGFYVNPYNYMQPSFHGGEEFPLRVLSFPAPLSPVQFEEFKRKTRESAYSYSCR